jgi:hypothetical protein
MLPPVGHAATQAADSSFNAQSRSGLSRRVPGQNLPPGTAPAEPEFDGRSALDPAAARAQAEAFTSGFERGSAATARPDGPDLARNQAEAFTAGFARGDSATAFASAAQAGQQPGQPGQPPAWPVSPARPTQPPQWPLGTPESAQPANLVGADGTATHPMPVGAGSTSTTNSSTAENRNGGASEGSGLTRRVPGAHLAEELRVPAVGRATPAGNGRDRVPLPAAVPDRDPSVEQRTLDLLVAGFARGAAAQPGAQPEPSAEPVDHRPVPEYVSRGPAGPEPHDVERR